jgi:hypothetical protein
MIDTYFNSHYQFELPRLSIYRLLEAGGRCQPFSSSKFIFEGPFMPLTEARNLNKIFTGRMHLPRYAAMEKDTGKPGEPCTEGLCWKEGTFDMTLTDRELLIMQKLTP